MQGWWGAPDYRVPTCRWHGKERQIGHGANISYISYMQGHLIAVVSGYTFEAFKRDGSRFIEGSSRSRADGSGTSRRRSRVVVEVDIHGRRGSSGTRSFF